MKSFTSNIINFYNESMEKVVDVILPGDCFDDSSLIRQISSKISSLIKKHGCVIAIYEDEKRWPLKVDEQSGFREVKEGRPLGNQYQLILQWLVRAKIITDVSRMMLEDSSNVYLILMEVDDHGCELDVRINHVNQSYFTSLINPYARKVCSMISNLAHDISHKRFMVTLGFDLKLFHDYKTLREYCTEKLGGIRVPYPEDSRKFEEDTHPWINQLHYPAWFQPTQGEFMSLFPKTPFESKARPINQKGDKPNE